jgi:hypothetical protein
MQRPDILSYGDLAILRGMRMLYHHREIKREVFEKYRRRYSPYGSVASLYLWAIAGGCYIDITLGGFHMKTLVVYYSKTGNTKKVAEAVIGELGCDHAELAFDENAKTIEGAADPSGYERVILLCPVWAFSLPEPMKLYLKEYGKSIQSYSLIVTYHLFGLRGCISGCVRATGKKPLKSLKIKDVNIKAGNFDIKPAL